jgi:hypothetical protein
VVSIVGIRLSSTDLVLIDQSGRTLATWPVNQAVLNVFGDIDAQIQLGSQFTWIRSIEGGQRVSCVMQSRHEETSNQRHNPY